MNVAIGISQSLSTMKVAYRSSVTAS